MDKDLEKQLYDLKCIREASRLYVMTAINMGGGMLDNRIHTYRIHKPKTLIRRILRR